MRVAVLIDSVSRNSGGLYDATRRLAQSLQQLGEDVRVFGVADGQSAADRPGWDPVPVEAVPVLGPRRFGYGPMLPRLLANFDPDVVMPQGLWTYTSVVSLRLARNTGRPYVIHPHGMLDRWAVQNSGLKKKIAARLFESRHLRGAGCIRALNASEANSIRAFGLRNPIAVIPNGVDLPLNARETQEAAVRSGETESRAHRKLLFLGRLHPKKGVAELIDGWNLSVARRCGWELEIAGWDDGGHEPGLRERTVRLGLERSVRWAGPLYGEEKNLAYSEAHALILPSFSEGLPMTILEAWAHGKPVLMTPQCHLPEGIAAGAGISVEPHPASIAEGLNRLAGSTERELADMGCRGRRLVEEKFTWPQIASGMKTVYHWILGHGPRPECVVV